MTPFPHVAVVDWSAASQPSPAREAADAIWIGICGPDGETTQYHRTRAGAEAALTALCATGRWLIGFDFPMGYPAGFAARLTGHAAASAVWHWLADQISDGPDNRNNRFAIAAAINRQFGGGPFWGRPATLDLPDLPPRKTVDYARLGLPERRRVEQAVPRAQPVWKLFTTGSVGSQSLMGLPMIARLAARPGISVWPFHPPARVVLTEVYPSLLGHRITEAMAQGETIKDRAQVRLLASALWQLSHSGQLAALLADAPDSVRQEEGWILGAGHAAALQRAAA